MTYRKATALEALVCAAAGVYVSMCAGGDACRGAADVVSSRAGLLLCCRCCSAARVCVCTLCSNYHRCMCAACCWAGGRGALWLLTQQPLDMHNAHVLHLSPRRR